MWAVATNCERHLEAMQRIIACPHSQGALVGRGCTHWSRLGKVSYSISSEWFAKQPARKGGKSVEGAWQEQGQRMPQPRVVEL